MIKEIIKKGEDINNTKLYDKILKITNMNSEMLGDYVIIWDIYKPRGQTKRYSLDYKKINKLGEEMTDNFIPSKSYSPCDDCCWRYNPIKCQNCVHYRKVIIKHPTNKYYLEGDMK